MGNVENCPDCGASVLSGQRSCGTCGKKLYSYSIRKQKADPVKLLGRGTPSYKKKEVVSVEDTTDNSSANDSTILDTQAQNNNSAYINAEYEEIDFDNDSTAVKDAPSSKAVVSTPTIEAVKEEQVTERTDDINIESANTTAIDKKDVPKKPAKPVKNKTNKPDSVNKNKEALISVIKENQSKISQVEELLTRDGFYDDTVPYSEALPDEIPWRILVQSAGIFVGLFASVVFLIYYF